MVKVYCVKCGYDFFSGWVMLVIEVVLFKF